MPSSAPQRGTSGFTTDFPWQPLANCGAGNPFFYHQYSDDFDANLATAIWTITHSNASGSVAHTAGDGGIALFTTGATSPAGADVASIQLPAASFTFTAGKKHFFLCRLQVSDAVNAAFNVGLVQTTTTPFTVTDGLYFNKATGSAANLLLRSTNTSANTDLTINTGYYTLANNTNIDLGWYVDRNQNVFAFVGSQLVGFLPNSGTGTLTPPPAGPMGSFTPSLTAANLNLTVALQAGTASNKTAKVDFVACLKER